jgi:nitrate/TMAO reductase-like tetraheme cytochrome c subunit
LSKFRFLKGDSHGNKKLFAIVGLAVALIFFFGLVAVSDMSSPESCANCHVIEPYYYTWQNSPHSNVGCLECHVEPGTGFLTVKMRGVKEWITYRTKDVSLPIQGKREISSEACLQCHSTNRRITPSLDLQSDFHTPHLGYGTSCADCHADVAHAGLTSMAAFQPTDDMMAKFKTVSYDDFSLRKTGCLECHDGKRVTYNCNACHQEIRIPQNHDFADFGYRHGPYVREDIADCMRCHTGFGKDRTVSGTSIPEITRNAKFCRDCHEGVRPVTHTAFWSVGHKIPGKADQTGCLVCHDWSVPQAPMPAANVISCASCHEQYADGHDDPRWYWDHKATVKDKGSFGCFDCHGATSCFVCHTKENVGFGQ